VGEPAGAFTDCDDVWLIDGVRMPFVDCKCGTSGTLRG